MVGIVLIDDWRFPRQRTSRYVKEVGHCIYRSIGMVVAALLCHQRRGGSCLGTIRQAFQDGATLALLGRRFRGTIVRGINDRTGMFGLNIGRCS